jgi:hypothetical protein
LTPKSTTEKGKTPEEMRIICEEILSWLKSNRKKDIVSCPQGQETRKEKKHELRKVLKILGVIWPYSQDYIKGKITLDSAIEQSRNNQLSAQISEARKATEAITFKHLTKEERKVECEKV